MERQIGVASAKDAFPLDHNSITGDLAPQIREAHGIPKLDEVSGAKDYLIQLLTNNSLITGPDSPTCAIQDGQSDFHAAYLVYADVESKCIPVNNSDDRDALVTLYNLAKGLIKYAKLAEYVSHNPSDLRADVDLDICCEEVILEFDKQRILNAVSGG